MRMLLACVHKLEVGVSIQLACVCRPMYAHAYSCLETLILSFLLLFFLLFYIICLYFHLLVCFYIFYFFVHVFVCHCMLD